MCACVSVYVLVHMHTGACGSQKWTLDPLELELQAGVSCLMWEPNSNPLQEQQVLLPHTPLQPLDLRFLDVDIEHLFLYC